MKYEFPPHINGDTFEGVRFTLLSNGSPLDLTSASVVMDISTPRYHTYFATSGCGLTITSGSSGILEFDRQIVDLGIGTFEYEIVFTSASYVKTYISGSWLLLEN